MDFLAQTQARKRNTVVDCVREEKVVKVFELWGDRGFLGFGNMSRVDWGMEGRFLLYKSWL